mmetsp:Transcript_20828/g.25087  ORF Transcript_20828/g.25087 Transcript_20828/m.25087 type:complete len:150 (-) Transcript_20828:283-732(-)
MDGIVCFYSIGEDKFFTMQEDVINTFCKMIMGMPIIKHGDTLPPMTLKYYVTKRSIAISVDVIGSDISMYDFRDTIVRNEDNNCKQPAKLFLWIRGIRKEVLLLSEQLIRWMEECWQRVNSMHSQRELGKDNKFIFFVTGWVQIAASWI